MNGTAEPTIEVVSTEDPVPPGGDGAPRMRLAFRHPDGRRIAIQEPATSCPVSCDRCISNLYYVDQGLSQDWNCGNATYSGHTGSDYSLRNGNFAIDDDNEVLAMASGTVVKAEDGYYDRCTQCGGANCGTGFGNGFANQVIVNHGAYRVIYGHMKMGSSHLRPHEDGQHRGLGRALAIRPVAGPQAAHLTGLW